MREYRLGGFMDIGYIRLSSEGERQNTDLQRDALIKAGVDPRNIFEDRISGAKDKREGLEKALAYLQSGDCLIVWKLDRLGGHYRAFFKSLMI